MRHRPPFHPGNLWHQIPSVAKMMLVGLVVISGWVVWQFVDFISAPDSIQANEDFFIHVAMLILVPTVTLALFAISFGYAYYQICKQHHFKPFWEKWKD